MAEQDVTNRMQCTRMQRNFDQGSKRSLPKHRKTAQQGHASPTQHAGKSWQTVFRVYVGLGLGYMPAYAMPRQARHRSPCAARAARPAAASASSRAPRPRVSPAPE